MRHGSGLDGRDVNCKPNLFRIARGRGVGGSGFTHISAVSMKFPPRLTNSSRILCERASSHWMPNVIVPA